MVAGRFLSFQTPTEVAEDNSFKQKKDFESRARN
jgi:hypothetical protein